MIDGYADVAIFFFQACYTTFIDTAYVYVGVDELSWGNIDLLTCE